VLVAMSTWTQKHFPKTRRPEAVQLVAGGSRLVKQLQEHLRREHGISR